MLSQNSLDYCIIYRNILTKIHHMMNLSNQFDRLHTTILQGVVRKAIYFLFISFESDCIQVIYSLQLTIPIR